MGWYGLLDTIRVNADHKRDDHDPPTTCPESGHLLESGPNGELHCKFSGWVWDGITQVD